MKKESKPDKPAVNRRRRKNDAVADWDSADATLLRSVVSTITKDGGAIRFGYSRDGGAYAVGIFGDGKPFTEYLGATENVDEWLEGFRIDYE